MDKVKMNIWNRACDLKVIFECYGNQEPTEGQKKRLETIMADNKCIDDAILEVKRFCLADENMNNESVITNIFKYVIPDSLYIKRDDDKDVVALLCDYKFDIEHGIAIVFEKKRLVGIAQQGEV